MGHKKGDWLKEVKCSVGVLSPCLEVKWKPSEYYEGFTMKNPASPVTLCRVMPASYTSVLQEASAQEP